MMEEALFAIGLALGAYAWVSRRFGPDGAVLSTPFRAGLWHAVFCAMVGFSACFLLLLSFESNPKFMAFPAQTDAARRFYPSLAVAGASALVGLWRGWRAARSPLKRTHYLAEDTEWAETVFSAVLLASVIMYFVVQPFKIPSGSMRNTLQVGDHLFVNKFIYGLRVPFSGRRLFAVAPVSRGDITVFSFPDGDDKDVHCGGIQKGRDFIKRVVGLPGDTVEVNAGRLLINGKPLLPEPYALYSDPSRLPPPPGARELSAEEYQKLWVDHQLDGRLGNAERDYFGPVTVPKESYFVMGDNRDQSCDSRYWGPVDMRHIEGKAWVLYWPPSRVGLIH